MGDSVSVQVRYARLGNLAGCGKTMLARENFDGPHVWHKSGLSGWSGLSSLFCFLTQRNQIHETDQTDQIDQMNKTGWRTFQHPARSELVAHESGRLWSTD